MCSHLALISLWEKSACSCPWQHCPHLGVSFRGNPSAQWSPPSLSWWWVKCPCWKLLGSDPLSLSWGLLALHDFPALQKQHIRHFIASLLWYYMVHFVHCVLKPRSLRINQCWPELVPSFALLNYKLLQILSWCEAFLRLFLRFLKISPNKMLPPDTPGRHPLCEVLLSFTQSHCSWFPRTSNHTEND